MRWSWLIAIGVGGCYAPQPFDPCTVRCASDSECPSGLSCNGGLCRATSECPTDVEVCVGGDDIGLVGRTCFRPVPPPRTIDALVEINTGNEAECDQPVTPNPDLCFVAADRIGITGTVRAFGSRPLVLWSATTIEITMAGRIDVASHANDARPGAGANLTACGDVSGIGALGTPLVGGGGCGGAFGSDGGGGGIGRIASGGATASSICNPSTVALGTELRGGCRGGNGGHGANGGSSGGAVYLMAPQPIVVRGRINASGAGGAATMADPSMLPGGGGGGSGGVIGFETPMLILEDALLLAVGGGGGSGTALQTDGNPGGEAPLEGAGSFVAPGSPMTVNANGGAANSIAGGLTGGDVEVGKTGGGGGGSGGHGYVVLFPPGSPTGPRTALPDFSPAP